VTLKQALELAAEKLSVLPDIEAPAFEAEVLLRYCLALDRAELHLNKLKELTPEQVARFFVMISRRLQGEPTNYITGHREFFGLDFKVDSRVLIPRPETELLVEQTLRIIGDRHFQTVSDIGTGSGIIAISLAVNLFRTGSFLNLPGSSLPNVLHNNSTMGVKIFATDISDPALAVARLNAQKHAVDQYITFCRGDLLLALPEPVDLVVANLPYVSTSAMAAMPSALFEPHWALDGGTTGLDQILRLISQLRGRIKEGGAVLLEIGMGQSVAIMDFFRRLYPLCCPQVLRDLAGIDRVIAVVSFHA
jgi:release factor glutamine methyltransferase